MEDCEEGYGEEEGCWEGGGEGEGEGDGEAVISFSCKGKRYS